MSTVMQAINGYANATFQARLRRVLEARGLTTSELIKKVYGPAKSEGYKVLKGRRKLTATTAPRWAEVLGVTPDEILALQSSPVREGETVMIEKKPYRGGRRVVSANPLSLHVRKLLTQRGMTLSDLARELGQKTSAPISGILTGRVPLSEKMSTRCAKVLGVTPESLLRVARQKTIRAAETSLVVSPPRGEQTVITPRYLPQNLDDRFSLSIDQSGLASIKLNLTDVPLNVALEIIAALDLPKLLNDRDSQKLTHVTPPPEQED